MSDLKIQIGADIKQAITALNSIQEHLTQTGKVAQTSGTALASSAQKATASLKKLAPVTGQANTALINFGRVVQDAPYGIIGIANNIDPLLASFQRLKTETGSTGLALKALGAGLLGPAGIAIGVSAVTSLLVSFGGTLFKNSSNAREAEEAIRSYESALQVLKDTAKDLKTSLDFGNELADINNQINQVSDIEGLRQKSVAQREFTQSRIDQQEELRRQMSALENDEKVSGDKRAELQQKLNAELRDLQTQEIESRNKQRALYRQIEFARVKDQIEAGKKAKEDLQRLLEERLKILKDFQFKFSHEKIPFPKIDFSALPKDLALGNDVLRDNLRDALKFGIEKRDILIEAAFKPAVVLGIEDLMKSVQEEIDKNKPPEMLITLKQANSAIDKIRKDIESGKFERPATTFEGILGERFPGFNEPTGFSAMQEQIKATAQSVNDLLTPAFQNMFDAITSGQAPLEAMFASIKNSINQLIGRLIAAAIQAAILSAFTGGASGGGLSFIKAFGRIAGLPGLAKGGIVPPGFGGDRYPALLSSGEAVIPLQKLSGILAEGMRLTMPNFPSNLLNGVNDPNLLAQRRYGLEPVNRALSMLSSSSRNEIITEHRISGDELVLLIRRAERRQGRVG